VNELAVFDVDVEFVHLGHPDIPHRAGRPSIAALAACFHPSVLLPTSSMTL